MQNHPQGVQMHPFFISAPAVSPQAMYAAADLTKHNATLAGILAGGISPAMEHRLIELINILVQWEKDAGLTAV